MALVQWGFNVKYLTTFPRSRQWRWRSAIGWSLSVTGFVTNELPVLYATKQSITSAAMFPVGIPFQLYPLPGHVLALSIPEG